MDGKRFIPGVKRRTVWIIACLLFLPMMFLTISSVACLCARGDAKIRALFIAESLIVLRMIVGLVRAEENWKAWFYLFLPIGLTVLVELLVRH
jgi:hypothetical protein